MNRMQEPILSDPDLLAQLDKRYVWHPFTPMKQYIESDPTIITDAEGFELIDSRGRRYIDGFGSLWCNLHGHRVPEIDRAIRAQLDRVAHTTLLGHGSPPSVALADRLVQASPASLRKVFYSDSGATAVEIAQKMVFQYFHNLGQKQRTRFIAFRSGYHGDTIGAVSVGGIDAFHRIFSPLLFETHFVSSPCPYRHPAGVDAVPAVLEEIEQVLRSHPGQICAVIVEPLIQGAGGMLTHPEGFLRDLFELTRRYETFLIADEVATGFFRTGRMFACEKEGVSPDLMCLGKGLTGGYLPVAATLTTQEIFEGFCGEIAEDKTFYHGHTFTGNALGCAAGVASFDLIHSSGMPEAMPGKIDLLANALAPLGEHPHVGQIRQAGMMVGIEIVEDKATGRGFDPRRRTGAGICAAAKARGVITRPLGDVVTLMPAPAMDLATLERLIEAIVATIREYFRSC
jgi:adenosylmethionine-8-amino-7-oxononanoate aminotransferase